MVTASHDVVIERPAAEIFAFLADGRNDPTWRDSVVEVHRTSETSAVGATYQQMVRGPGGARMAADYTICEYDPPYRLGFRVTAGPVRPSGRFELTPDGPNRTSVRSVLELELSGGMRLMGSLIGKEFDKEVRQIERLKEVLER